VSLLSVQRSSIGLVFSRTGSIVLEFAAIALAGRELGPDILGAFFLFVAVIQVATLATRFGLGVATSKRISERTDRFKFFTASITLRLALMFISCLFLLAFRETVTGYLNDELFFPYLFIGLLLLVLRDTVNSGLKGEGKVGRMGSVTASEKLVRLALWAGIIAAGGGLTGLVVGYLGGLVASVAIGKYFTTLRLSVPEYHHFVSLYTFAKFSWIGSVRGSAWEWTDVLVLGMFVEPYLIGIYEIAWRISKVFLVVSSAVGEALFPRVSELSTENNLHRISKLVNKGSVYAGLLAIPGVAGSIFLGQSVLQFFGTGAATGGMVLTLLISAQLLSSYDSVFGSTLDAMNRPDLLFRISLFALVSNVVLNLALVSTIGWRGAAVATLVTGAVTAGGSVYFTSCLVSVDIPIRPILSQAFAASAMYGFLQMLGPMVGQSGVVRLLWLVSTGGVAYVVVLVAVDGNIRKSARRAVVDRHWSQLFG